MAEATSSVQQQPGQTTEVSAFQSLLRKEFRTKTDRAQEQVETAVKTLAEQVLKDTGLITDDGRIRAVLEHMTQMPAATSAVDLGSGHSEQIVVGCADGIIEGLPEARPAGLAVVFGL